MATKCKYCRRETGRSARSLAENPFCNECLTERSALSALRQGTAAGEVVDHGDGYASHTVRRLTAPERRELLATVKRERAKREPPAALEPARSITSAVDSRAVSAGERARRPVRPRAK